MSDIVERLRGAYSTVFTRSLAREAADEIDRLRGALTQIASGNCRVVPTTDQCKHAKYGYEHCEDCYADHALAALIPKPEDDVKPRPETDDFSDL